VKHHSLKILYTITAYPPAVGGAQLHTHKIASILNQTHTISVITHWTENRTDWLLGTTLKAPETVKTYELDRVPVQQITLSQSERRALIPYVLGYYAIKKMAVAQISDKLLPKLEAYAPPDLDLIQNIRIGREGLSYASFKLARKLNIPFIFVPLHHPRWVGWNYREYINLYKQADGVIALTNSEKQILIDLGVKPEKIFITGIGPLIADTSDPEEFRQQYSLGDDPIILFLGQKYQYKGFQVLLSGAQQVWKKLPDVRFVFIGPRTDYSEKVFAEVNDPRVLELGKVSLEEKTNALAACDILCVPSMQESFGGIYTEGWIMKKPVIGGDIPAIRDVIDDGLNGFLVQQDAGQMAEKICQLIEDTSLREKMGAAGYQKVVEQYTWEKLAAKMEAAYRQVLQG
jgi:glycosyltransferase involved in cell wall biosynthesis